MAKGKSTLFSKISGHFKNADNLTLRTRDDNIILEKYPKPAYTRSPAQDEQRTLYSDAVNAWHAATDEEKEKYRPIASRRQITLYNAFISSKLLGELPEGTQIIKVDNSNNPAILSDYQILLSVNEDLDFFSDLLSDSNHIEIYDRNQKTALSFWIESFSSEEKSAKIWIKVPEIPASSQKKIYLIPNLERSEPLSDFNATFAKNYVSPNIAGLWHLDEGEGYIIHDNSGNNNHADIVSPRWAGYDGGQWADRSDISFSSGDCMEIKYTSQNIIAPHSPSLDFKDTVSMEAWVKTISENKQTIIEKYKYGGGFALYIYSDGTISIDGYDGSGSYVSNTGTTKINDGKWHHIAATVNKSAWKSYIDGVLEKTTDTGYDETSLSNDSGVGIGTHILNSGLNLVGFIDEVSIYARLLSAEEIKAHYERRKYTNPEPGISHITS